MHTQEEPKLTLGDLAKLGPILWVVLGGAGTAGAGYGLDLFGTRAQQEKVEILLDRLGACEAEKGQAYLREEKLLKALGVDVTTDEIELPASAWEVMND